jgi:hypothetical protein
MNARDSIDIVTAALRLSTAYERRRAAGTEKRIADQAHSQAVSSADRLWGSTLTRAVEASRRVTELKRQERAAMRALSKACAKARGSLLDADIADPAASASRAPVLELPATFLPEA